LLFVTNWADDRTVAEIVTEFFLKTCLLRRRLNHEAVTAIFESGRIEHISLGHRCARCRPNASNDEVDYVQLPTGSTAEFYIEPMMSCFGDVDMMVHYSNQLAIPQEHPPPTELPAEFHGRVDVYEIIDSEFPGYVY